MASSRTRTKLNATTLLQREGGQRLEATTTKRCSSAGECRNEIPNCSRHRLQTTEHHARRASWMRADRATSSIKGTSESSKRIICHNYSTQVSATRASTNIYTIECTHPKDKTPKDTTGGFSQKCVEVAPNGPPGPALLC